MLLATPHRHFATLARSLPDNSIPAQKISAGPAANGNVRAHSGWDLARTKSAGQDCWRLRGNSGTIPWVNFLGTTDNQPLHLAGNGNPVFQLVPTRNPPSIIGGYYGNYATTE